MKRIYTIDPPDLPLYADIIRKWLEEQSTRRFNHQITDSEIWTAIGLRWPFLPQSTKATIFQLATGFRPEVRVAKREPTRKQPRRRRNKCKTKSSLSSSES